VLESVLSGVAGALLGVLFGGTGKYWALRRDAWTDARKSGLLLLADVRALMAAAPEERVVVSKRLGLGSWETHRATLAGFRRGTFPNGYEASEWLDLAAHFASLEQLLQLHQDGRSDPSLWAKANDAWTGAEQLLVRFKDDPPVVGYVLKASFRR
jgi:hypothetical protein